MDIKLKGLHKVSRKLADGTMRVHYYAWRGGPKITSKPGSAEFVKEFEALRNARSGIFPEGTIGHMIDMYLSSPDGKSGVEKTVSERNRYCMKIREVFGSTPVKALEGRKIRTVLYKWRDSMADKPRAADEYWSQFRRMVKWGCRYGYCGANPLSDYVGIYEVNRSDIIWTPDKISCLFENCRPELRHIYQASIHLGARMIDLRNLKWSNIKLHETIYQPTKGRRFKRVAKIPHNPYFRAVLKELEPRRSIFVFTNTQGRPWTESALKSADSRARKAAGLEYLHFHDLRGTAATIKASQSKTAIQIAGMLGWSLTEVETMLNRYVSWNDVNEDWSWAVNGL